MDVSLVDGEGDRRRFVGEEVLDARPDVPVRKGKLKCLAMSTPNTGRRKYTFVDGLLTAASWGGRGVSSCRDVSNV